MCSQSRFSTRPSWLDVLSPDGLEWLWKSALIQPGVLRCDQRRPQRRHLSAGEFHLCEDGVVLGPWLTITSYAPGASGSRYLPVWS